MTASDLHVSDPRDFIYSLVSLARSTYDFSALTPDYKKAPLAVRVELIDHVVRTRKYLDLICYPWAPNGLKLPS